jgi:phosphoenolpyruvate-protein phosphotransferase/dihydroxyacetone kinase phosphotransfer subunit
MIGIVIVSHSAKLAEGVVELARGMAGEEVKLAAAGGMAGQLLGTDPGLVLQAIEAVYSEDGVVVLMDLGSAVLSTEMALEMLSPAKRAHVALCEAPLVEGAVSAAVQARLGSSLDQVLAEARGALAFKVEHLRPEASPPEVKRLDVPLDARSLRLVISNRLGLHARPAARFVQTAGRFQDTRLTVRNLTTGRGPVEACSINSLATLGVRQGHEIEIQAAGPQAEAALAALQSLAEANFGDSESEAPALQQPITAQHSDLPAGALAGIPGSSGIAAGAARHFRLRKPDIPQHASTDPAAEWARLAQAIQLTRQQIERTLAEVTRRADRHTAAIFEAHLLFLEDSALREPARRLIQEERLNAAAAWDRAVEAVAGQYRALEDEYMRARAADVLDVGCQVVMNLLGVGRPIPVLAAPGILIASDLSPADTVHLDPSRVLGICTAFGGPTSHSAILARTFGIPAVVGMGEQILAIPEGCPLIVDAAKGWVLPHPDAATSARYASAAQALRQAADGALAESAAPAVSKDGRRVEVGANIGSLAEARAAVAAGAEGVGLLRTEFLYLDRASAPDEEEQFAAYREIAEAMGGHPVIIRTLDIGGDKPLPYIDLGQEANPFLGWRAIRMCLAHPEFFKVQLRAILRTAALHPVKVMFPMVATLEEIRAAKALLAEARAEVTSRGQGVPERLETGIMVEIPAAAIRADQLAPEVDFFSIGTNDLTQYTMAAERGNARVAALTDAFHPAVLELIQRVVDAAHAHGKWAGICGELGGEPLAVPILLGMGIDELSMNAPSIPRSKQLIRGLDFASARRLASAVLRLESPSEVRAAVVAAVQA